MPTERVMIRLFRHGMRRGEGHTNLDPRNEARLRQELVDRVAAANKGSWRGVRLEHWHIEVAHESGYPWICRVTVDDGGKTVVTR